VGCVCVCGVCGVCVVCVYVCVVCVGVVCVCVCGVCVCVGVYLCRCAEFCRRALKPVLQ